MSKQNTILVIDTVHPILLQLLIAHNFVITEAYDWDKEKIVKEIHNFKGLIIRSRITIDKTIIDAASQLHFIARYGAGMEKNADLLVLLFLFCIRFVPVRIHSAVVH